MCKCSHYAFISILQVMHFNQKEPYVPMDHSLISIVTYHKNCFETLHTSQHLLLGMVPHLLATQAKAHRRDPQEIFVKQKWKGG